MIETTRSTTPGQIPPMTVRIKAAERADVIARANDQLGMGIEVNEDGTLGPMLFPQFKFTESMMVETEVIVTSQSDVMNQLMRIEGPINGDRMARISIIAGLYGIVTRWTPCIECYVTRDNPFVQTIPIDNYNFDGCEA